MIKYWYLGSDLHGDSRTIKFWVENYLPTPHLPTPVEESALILLGDVGANYYGDYRDRNFKKELNKFGLTIYCLRGNHEMRVSDAAKFGNYKLVWDDNVQGLVYIEAGFPNIHYFLDEGGIYNINGHSTLIIPGAYSVDKHYRLQMGWNWFSNEQLNIQEQIDLINIVKNKKFDYILAHTCPHSWEPYIDDLFMESIDQSKVDKTTEDFIDDLLEFYNCNYNHYYFGHFHDDREIPEVNATMLYKFIIPFGNHLIEKERN